MIRIKKAILVKSRHIKKLLYQCTFRKSIELFLKIKYWILDIGASIQQLIPRMGRYPVREGDLECKLAWRTDC